MKHIFAYALFCLLISLLFQKPALSQQINPKPILTAQVPFADVRNFAKAPPLHAIPASSSSVPPKEDIILALHSPIQPPSVSPILPSIIPTPSPSNPELIRPVLVSDNNSPANGPSLKPPILGQSANDPHAISPPILSSPPANNLPAISLPNLTGQPANNLPAISLPTLNSPPPKPIPCWQTDTPFAPEGELRRAPPAPLDSVFPGQEWVGQPLIGVPDTDRVWPLESMIYKACPALKRARIKIYGWVNPGYGYSSSKYSNIPLTYAIVPRRLELEQLILRIERTPDTVQKEHMDWGFRVSNLYGIDYRWTTALGWYPASNQLLNHNYLYGYDPVELYGQIYIPKVAQGMVIKFGRYISPPDIEAQLAPDNYLWTHSIMFTFDAYTHTGIQTTTKLSDQWMLQGGIHSVSDMAPWAPGAEPTLEAYLRWVSKSNNDSVFGGVDGLNNGRFRLAREVVQAQQYAALTGTAPAQIPAHDNLQQFNITWGHRFSRRLHTMTEAYFLYSIDALQGGTVNNGPPHTYNALTGPGSYLPGVSTAWGFVNYTAFKCTDKDYITIRPVDYLIDPRGWRTGFATTYSSWTIGWAHHFSDYLTIRPEIRYERALTDHDGTIVTPFNNGTRRYQFTIGMDLIQRF